MTRNNWVQKFPSEIYSTLFRFEKEDIMCLIDALDVPYFLSFESRHSTNWLEWEILTETLSTLFFSFEAVHILLRRLSFPCRWSDLSVEFDLRCINFFHAILSNL